MNLHVLRCNGVDWKQRHPSANLDHLGLIPQFVTDADERPPVAQFAERYGWHPMAGFRMDEATDALKYPGDPAMPPLYEASVGGERVLVYESGWVAVVHGDGTFSASRLD